MRKQSLIAVLMLFGLVWPGQAGGKHNLKVLYIGSPGTARAQAFTEFLQTRFIRAEAVARESFAPAMAARWDVVLLDWPQAQEPVIVVPGNTPQIPARRIEPAPLGSRASWSKPTVLLGSAGLKLAEAWRIGGGYG